MQTNISKLLLIMMACFSIWLATSSVLLSEEKPEIFVQLGHMAVNSVAFSSDGRFALSGSHSEFTMKLWDINTGKEVRTFSGHTGYVNSVAFSPDSKYALSGSNDKSMKLWDINTGKDVRTFSGHTGYVNSVTLSSDGRFALSGSNDKSMILWDINTGRKVRTFSDHSMQQVRSVALSPDGNLVLSGTGDMLGQTLKLWDIKTGRKIRAFLGYLEPVTSVAFSPDGKYALSGSLDKTMRLWDISTGRELKTFSAHDRIRAVTFSPDGRFALSGSNRDLMLWDIKTGKAIKTFPGHIATDKSIAFSPDGRFALSGSDRDLMLWDINTGRKVRTFSGYAEFVNSVAFSPDGRFVLIGSERTLKLSDINSGREIRTFSGHVGTFTSVAFSPDGKYVLSGSHDKTIKLWDIDTGEEIKTFSGHEELVNSVAFSPDGNFALSGTDNNTLRLWDINTGREIRTMSFPRDSNRELGPLSKHVLSVTFSPDGRFALSGSGDEILPLRLWDIKTGREIRTFSGHAGPVRSVVFSPDGKFALSGSYDNTMKLWDLKTGREMKSFSGHASWILSVAFSPDGKYALSGSHDKSMKLWDIDTGRELRNFSGHANSILSVSFSPDGRSALAGSNNIFKLWDKKTGKEIAQFSSFKNDGWIVITPEGYYNSSLYGHKYLNVRQGLSVYGIDQFYDVFYRPDIVMAKLKGEDIKPLITLTIDDAIKYPPPEVEFISVPPNSTTPKVKVCYQAKNTGGGIGEVRLFHNGKLIQSDGFYKDVAKTTEKIQLASLDSKSIREDMRSIVIKTKGDIGSITSKAKGNIVYDCVVVDAVPGENEVSVTAFNKENTIQSYMKTTSFKADIQSGDPHLYMLIVGVDQYNDPNINLKYAVKDASDIQEKLLNQSATIYKPENIHATILKDKEATKANIQTKIAEYSKLIKPTDGFILFVAGHGVLLQNQYFMLTHDFDGTVNDKTLISSNELVEASKQIKSLSQLLIFDTCHAGGVDYIVSGLYDARMSVLAKKMGLHIYASASDKQSAMDGYKGNGLFTHTLLDGLDNKKEADINKDGKIGVVGLGRYSKKLTGAISKEIGHEQTPLIINFGKDYPLYQLQ